MEAVIKKVSTRVEIIFSDGSAYNLPLKNNNADVTDLQNYCTSCKLSEKLYSASSSNILGNVCSNILTIDGKSKDKLLISTNETSVYFGMMNHTARVKIYCTGSDDVETYMGMYFVDTWENGARSDDSTSFTLSCVSIISRIKNIKLNKIRLKQKIKFSDYIKLIIDKLNENIDLEYSLRYSMADMQKLDNLYSDDWQMYYNNINRDSIENILNTIALNTLTYIWIDRDNYVKVDSLIDDDAEQAVCVLSGSTNLLSYNVEAGDIGSYSGVDVKYVESVSYEDKKLVELSDVDLYFGLNEIEQSVGEKVLRVNVVEIKCTSGSAYCKEVYTYNNSINLQITADASTKASIVVYGTIINENYNNIKKYKSISDKLNTLNLENFTLRADDVDIYAENILNMLNFNNYIMSAEGFINPSLKLGDSVSLVGNKLGINNIYKIIEMSLVLGSNYRCSVKLLKSVEKIGMDIDSILRSQLDILYNNINGIDESSSSLNDVTDTEDAYIQLILGDNFNNLETVMDGN